MPGWKSTQAARQGSEATASPLPLPPPARSPGFSAYRSSKKSFNDSGCGVGNAGTI